MTGTANRRILLIDDTPSIHEDFRKILETEKKGVTDLDDAKAAFFGAESVEEQDERLVFELDSAYQGQEGLELVLESVRTDNPYALAFVDVRMPPGWDGIQTIKQLWQVDTDLQVVICTAYSDYSWDQTIEEVGQTERLLILKKPFDSVEIRQLAAALTDKWNTAQRERQLIDDLKRAEAEARAYASSLETVNQALITSKATAEKSNELKSEFLVHLSQQVNSNLSTILGQVDQAAELEGLETVLDTSRHLMGVLDEILDITLIESGRLKVESSECAPARLVEDVVESLRYLADEKGLGLSVEYASPIPEAVSSDAMRLCQILKQLLENAIQFTDTGDVRVVVRMEQTADWQTSMLRCDVVDTGKGIPDEFKGRVFQPFACDAIEGESPSGPGIGLALAKQLARLMGGDIEVESSPGQGTTFRLLIETGNLSGVKMVGEDSE